MKETGEKKWHSIQINVQTTEVSAEREWVVP